MSLSHMTESLDQAFSGPLDTVASCQAIAEWLTQALTLDEVRFVVKDEASWRYVGTDNVVESPLDEYLGQGMTRLSLEGLCIGVVPLSLSLPCQGAVLLMSKGGDPLQSSSLETLLQAATPYIGTAIMADVHEKQGRLVTQFTRKIRALQQVSLVINNTYDLNELSSAICSITTQAVGAQYAGLYHLEGNCLRMIEDLAVFRPKGLSLLKMLQEANQASKHKDIPLEQAGFLAEAIRTGNQIVIEDLTTIPLPEELLEHQLVSAIATPLVTQREVLGVLLVGTNERRPFSVSETELLADIARQATGAFITNKLYLKTVEEKQRADRMVEQLKILNEATAEVGKSLDMTTACNELFRHISMFISLQWGGIFMKSGDGHAYMVGTDRRLETPPELWLDVLQTSGLPKSLVLPPELLEGTPFSSETPVILFPLVASNNILGLGVIALNKAAEATGLDLVETLVGHTALALNNAIMHTKVEQQAITDGLTAVYNRRYFNDRLQVELNRSERYHHPVSLVILDIDYFKKCNDVLGHLGGDTVLKELAALLKEKVRTVDIVARYGGEEFAIILPETPVENAFLVSEKLRARIEEFPFTQQEALPHKNITASIGVASYPEQAHDFEDLIRCADEALYQAKQGGRNRTCCAS